MKAITLKLNQLDSKIEKYGEDINASIFGTEYKSLEHSESDIISICEKYCKKLERSDRKDKLYKLLNNFKNICGYRRYHKKWMWYPLYWNLIILLVSIVLILFGKSIENSFVYIESFIIVCSSTFWVAYLSLSFVSDFLENNFIND
jgi:hypothetical protein